MISSDVMHVKEMIYLNREAQLGLWEFIHAHDSMIDEVRETITTVSQSHLNLMTAILKRQSAHTQWGELLISDSSLPNMPAADEPSVCIRFYIEDDLLAWEQWLFYIPL